MYLKVRGQPTKIVVNLLENKGLEKCPDIISGNTGSGIPPLKGQIKYLHIIR